MRAVTVSNADYGRKTKDPVDAESRLEGAKMLQTLAVILLVLWATGLGTS